MEHAALFTRSPRLRLALGVLFLALHRALFLALLGATVAHACRAEPAPAAERAWSVQLHLHGSASEGEGSIDSHSFEAGGVGCDVLWWSDHDFRVTTYQHLARFGFEGPAEPLGRNESWAPRLKRNVSGKKILETIARPAQGELAFVEAPVQEGERSLKLAVQAQGDALETGLVCVGSDRFLFRRSLATGVTVRLAVYPESAGEDAWGVVEAQLSEHAPRDGLGLVPLFVRYLLGPQGGAPRREGQVWLVPVAVEPGHWNELALPVTADAVRAFTGSPGEDNALYRLAFGVQARRGARAAVCFDDLCIEQERAGPEMLPRQAALIEQVGALYPGLVELQGLEVSYGSRHLNVFCEEPVLPDYDAVAEEIAAARPGEAFDERAFRAAVIERVVAEVHRRGGLVSYNHPFGSGFEESERRRTNAEQLELLLRVKAEGADLLEVGYRDRGGASLDDHLWLWDQAALAGLRLVGTGVSDSHGGQDGRWRGTPNNFVSWIWAPRADRGALIAGLRAGRVFFGDLERFDGTLDLELPGGERMGATVKGGGRAASVELRATGTKPGQRIVVVESGTRARTYPIEAAEFRQQHELELPPDRPAFVRFELHDDSGAIALSNPIYFVP